MSPHQEKLMWEWVRRVLFYALVVLVLVYTLFPFYWALNGSLQPRGRLYAIPADYVPLPGTIASYAEALRNRQFLLAIRNSALVATGSTAAALLIGSLAAYALARLRLRGRGVVLSLVLAMTMFPQITVLGALFTLVTWLGLHDTLTGLGMTYLLLTLPLTVWVMMNFFKSLPLELEESAYMDGATPLQTLWHVLVPLSMPGLATTGLLAFIVAWNEYLFALSLTVTDEARTITFVIANYAGGTTHEVPWGPILAASIIVTLPLVLLVLVFQKRIIAGLTAGAVKG